jgi:hypothetical protein
MAESGRNRQDPKNDLEISEGRRKLLELLAAATVADFLQEEVGRVVQDP